MTWLLAIPAYLITITITLQWSRWARRRRNEGDMQAAVALANWRCPPCDGTARGACQCALDCGRTWCLGERPTITAPALTQADLEYLDGKAAMPKRARWVR